MSNEFTHKDAGVRLTQAEDNALDRHEADGQTANDMLYFNGTYWIRATPATIRGLLEHNLTFMANGFRQTIWPAARWQSVVEGVYLEASWSAKVLYIDLNFLKVGDKIISYKLVGDMIDSTACTLDCQLVRVDYADPITHTDITGGAIAQVNTDGNFSVEATLSAAETIATSKMYVLEITGTTSSSDEIYVMGAEVTITRKI